MAYPGEGYSMSQYGLKTYTPEEEKEQWRELVEREEKMSRHHTSRKLKEREKSANEPESDSSQQQPEKLSYFDNNKEYEKTTTYDRMFHVKEGYSCKLKRDDLEHTIGLNVHSEEVSKPVPILSSSVYGHPVLKPLETPDRKYVRVATVKKEFYRPSGADATFSH